MTTAAKFEKLLGDLAHADGALRSDLLTWQPSFLNRRRKPFKRVKHHDGVFAEVSFIDWRKLFGVNGSVSLYKLPTPQFGLLYYDTIFLGINSCPLSEFDLFHEFKWSDLDQLMERARVGRVKFYLTDRPRDYIAYDYLLPLFEEFQPLHLVHSSRRIARQALDFDEVSEGTTDLAHIQAAISRFASNNHFAVEVADASICYTLQELYYAGHQRLANVALDFLTSDPDAAIDFIWTLKRAVVDPQSAAPTIPTALDLSQYEPAFARAVISMNRQRISSVPEIGQVLAKYLSFPTPADWDSLHWCEENLDLPAIRRTFAILDRDARSISKETDTDLKSALADTWVRRDKSFSTFKNRIFWGTSLSLAVAGTFVSGPVTGLLAALGLTAASNLWLEPVSASASRLFRPQTYHIWDAQRRLARPKD